MAAFVSKMTVVGLLSLMVLLQLQTPAVEAVDILYYKQSSCNGPVWVGCYNVAANECCTVTSAGAVQIRNLLNGETATTYTGGGCKTVESKLKGPTKPGTGECYYNAAFSGASWSYNS